MSHKRVYAHLRRAMAKSGISGRGAHARPQPNTEPRSRQPSERPAAEQPR